MTRRQRRAFIQDARQRGRRAHTPLTAHDHEDHTPPAPSTAEIKFALQAHYRDAIDRARTRRDPRHATPITACRQEETPPMKTPRKTATKTLRTIDTLMRRSPQIIPVGSIKITDPAGRWVVLAFDPRSGNQRYRPLVRGGEPLAEAMRTLRSALNLHVVELRALAAEAGLLPELAS